jgi:hypothetical protein
MHPCIIELQHPRRGGFWPIHDYLSVDIRERIFQRGVRVQIISKPLIRKQRALE